MGVVTYHVVSRLNTALCTKYKGVKIMYQIKQLPFSLKAEDIQEVLNISRSAAYALMKRKDFPTIVIGKSKRVKAEDFLKWVDAQKVGSNVG